MGFAVYYPEKNIGGQNFLYAPYYLTRKRVRERVGKFLPECILRPGLGEASELYRANSFDVLFYCGKDIQMEGRILLDRMQAYYSNLISL